MNRNLRVQKNFNIIVVDDEPAAAELVTEFLLQSGFVCETFTEASEVVTRLGQGDVDLVISDIKMPIIDGVQLADIVNRVSPRTRIILMSGCTEYRMLADATKRNPQAYIEKPVKHAELVFQVEKAYEDRLLSVQSGYYKEGLRAALARGRQDLVFARECLAAEKKIMQGVISNANFGLVAVDSVGSVHLMNSYFSELFGLDESTSTNYQGRKLDQLLPVGQQSWFQAMAEDVTASDRLTDRNFTLSSGDRQLNIIAYPLHHLNRITAVVFVVHDVTEKEVLQRRLLQSAKLASIGELAAGVAHEINNPLGFVTSNCNTLGKFVDSLLAYISDLETGLAGSSIGASQSDGDGLVAELKKSHDIEYISDDVRSLIGETLDGLNRVSKIVLDLKSFARVDSDNPEVSQVNSLIEDALNLVRNETKYSLSIEKDLAALPTLSCFPSQLVQVFTNIFVNAAHAVKEKGTLSISSSVIGECIKINIRDDGDGIPKETLPRIFDPFFTTKDVGKGTGMGLSISYGIIEKHGGTISATSTVGEGTEFVISLPLGGVPAKRPEPEDVQ